ncbi:caspase family protein [Longimicrobium sp.]|uniref:caspase family protein n=1 Tax=Longimicrobium sp. TaxID=2029185 RepID=UPI002E343B6A|nr:caspase family protein [Longimicrobium sp.]HEX6042475.1 caspase family protein [Longimicrobium sp.]
MARAMSLHIGVNVPAGRMNARPLNHSEDFAWKMAVLANQAGYASMTVLRNQTATRQAVQNALTEAAELLGTGDSLLVTFSGHGTQEHDVNQDERGGVDEGWCLADGVLLDDELAGYWTRFSSGVRIVVVSESCHSGGIDRDDEDDPSRPQHTPHTAPPVYRGEEPVMDYSRTCTGAPRSNSRDIRADVLLLTACRKEEEAVEGIFSGVLLDLWADGTFQGNYCELYQRLHHCVSSRAGHHPEIMLLGAGNPAFPLEPAFRVAGHGPRYRDAYGYGYGGDSGYPAGDGYRGGGGYGPGYRGGDEYRDDDGCRGGRGFPGDGHRGGGYRS